MQLPIHHGALVLMLAFVCLGNQELPDCTFFASLAADPIIENFFSRVLSSTCEIVLLPNLIEAFYVVLDSKD
jgi:hypothetical protein